MMESYLKSISFASEQLLTMMSIFLPGCMLTGKLPSTLMHLVIIPLLKCKSKDPGDVNNYIPIAIATALSKVLSRSCCRASPGTCGLQTANFVSSKHMGQKLPYLHSSKLQIVTVIRTHLYTCAFLMRKRHLIELFIGPQQKNCWTEMCHCIL